MKTIQQRIDAAQEKLTFIRINHTLDELISKSEEEAHVCLGSECLCNIQNACKGAEAEHCPGDGSCQAKHRHAVEFSETWKLIP